MDSSSGYSYADARLGHAHGYLLPVLSRITGDIRPCRVFELGCGNGAVANWMAMRGFEVTGIDSSESGIKHARSAYPNLHLDVGSAYDDLASRYGRFPIVLSLEVVEHLFAPRKFASSVFNLCEPNGIAIISTPYHGYLKNLALALSGRMDAHFTALWDGGHIKFWSERTLRVLLKEAGFSEIAFYRAGRIAPLAKSMIAVARRPKS